jgi:hypothetical protein
MTNELSTLATLLGREHWRVESVTVRIHVLRMAISGEWPGSVDDADAGLADAVDRLRQEELARAVVANGCGARYGLEGEPTLSQLVAHASDEAASALLGAADGLAVAIEAARTAAAEATARLDDAAYDRPSGTVTPAITPTRAATIARLLQRVVPPSIDHFLAQRVG